MERSQEEWDERFLALVRELFPNSNEIFAEMNGDLSLFRELSESTESSLSPWFGELSVEDYYRLYEAHISSSYRAQGISGSLFIPHDKGYEMAYRLFLEKAEELCTCAEDFSLFLGRVSDPYEARTFIILKRLLHKYKTDPAEFMWTAFPENSPNVQFMLECLVAMEGSFSDWSIIANGNYPAYHEDTWYDDSEYLTFTHAVYRICIHKMDEIVREGANKLKEGIENS